MKISHAKGYRGFWIVGLYLNGGDLIAGKDRRASRRLQSTTWWSAMGDGGQLTGVRGSSDSGHPYRNQIRGDDLRVFANSTGYLSGMESTSRRWSHGGALLAAQELVATPF